MVQVRKKKRQERSRIEHIERIYNGFSDSCVNYIRMRSGAFVKLVSIMRNNRLLKDSRNISVEEQFIMTLNILGHKSKNRIVRSHFIRSGETVSRYFNKVLQAIICLRGRYMRQAINDTPQEIVNNQLYYPYFKVYLHFNHSYMYKQ